MSKSAEASVKSDGDRARREQARETAEACARILKERFGVREVHLFGSLAGQSPWHSRSDIDLAVEGLAPQRYFAALSALWQILPVGLDLDLITLEDALPELVARVKGEVKMPEDPKQALKMDITAELLQLDRTVADAKLVLQQIMREPTFIEINGAGKVVHDFYNGVERIFERIAVRLGPGLPVGPGWHTLLLRSMESPVESIRPSVIDHALALRLVDYLGFRHLFRHSYGYELQWDRVRPLIEELETTLGLLRQKIAQFVVAL